MTATTAAPPRRSWFAGPRLWPTALVLLAVVVAVVVTSAAATGSDPLVGLSTSLFVVAGAVGGSALKLRWVRRDWRRLHDDALAGGLDPMAGERVARDGVEPTFDDQRQLALRICEQRWRDFGGWVQGPVLTGLAAVVLAALAVTSSPAWWPLCAVAAVVVLLAVRAASRQARRRAQLEGLR